MIAAVLFDLDGTLVDTSKIELLRKARKWKDCVSSLHLTIYFDGVSQMLSALHAEGMKIGIVTTSVSFYAERVCKHHEVPYDVLIAYHDARPKPAPDPFLLALKKLKVDRTQAIGVGDDLPDLESLRSGNIRAIGAGWSPFLKADAGWDHIVESPAALLEWIEENTGD